MEGKILKKAYETPRAEKLEFNYTKVVVASDNHANNKPKYNNDPNGQYYKCLSTNYWGC